MKELAYCIILICLSFNSYGQKFEVPDSILNGVESRQFEYTYTAKFDYKVIYPTNYDSLTTYKVLLGLSGGNANEQIVNYCYYTLFDSKYFDNYITILPLGPSGRPLTDLDSTEINLLISDIMKSEKVTNHNWIVAGTSMGGFAAFNFAYARPELFEGIITFPGGLRTEKVSKKWTNYKVLLAVGELDEANWTSLNESTKSKLEGNVKSVETFIMKEQDHIVSPDYDIDKIYSKYFTKKK
jgi:enterochelin esterase-like enzyme